MPSRGASIFKNPIFSDKDPGLYIFIKTNLSDKYSAAAVTKVFSFLSRNKTKYPSFTLRPEGVFGKYKRDIKYDAEKRKLRIRTTSVKLINLLLQFT